MNPPEVQLPGHLIRVGCDVVALEEIENSLSSFGDRFLAKIYTAAEVATCAGSNRLARLAARFAAKEAAMKAFARPDAALSPLEMEVVLSGDLPTLRLSGSAAQLAVAQRWLQVSMSITHADCHAAAVVVAVCAE
ncbi:MULTISPECIES: 4'-phosphopantetheinyl transferase superfamily protein [unclassified Mycobacterium]|uniref:4'-phosphopantetheinyl transferase superfamily protein n=1 Tax=unclassified Mycobacterium TaxID=2642494 RepID=UPI00074031F3|nr:MULTISPECIES: 4'-phosphopantetheinyl transferase superfamily protein [unclassified Mycobacterium]KUH82707.1 ACP synthase [Mycobacterium sp. GA-1999]KUH88025.1 ACP synthase [Mycobacterium sp. GA-0227b]